MNEETMNLEAIEEEAVEEKVIYVPKVQDMDTYLIQHYKDFMMTNLNTMLDNGRIGEVLGHEVVSEQILPGECNFRRFDYWRLNQTDLLIDIDLRIELQVKTEAGITATAGIGQNLYLCKIAMDIVAKHIPADENGVRIAELDEMEYRKQLWEHRPLTDFWRVGAGISRKLEAKGLYTMGDIACYSLGPPYSVYNEDTLYKLFGVNAELLIDHAWGWEPCTIRDIKAFKPENDSLSSGQVLQSPYPFDKAKLIVKEMTDALVLELVDKHLETDQIVLTVCYDTENLKQSQDGEAYQGEVETDRYGRKVPKPVHGSVNLGGYSSSTKLILEKTVELYDRIADPRLLIRRVYVVANHLMDEASVLQPVSEQMDFFTDYRQEEADREAEEKRLAKEEKQQKVLLEIKRKFGKNAILKGMNLEEGATGKDRNEQIGGHKA